MLKLWFCIWQWYHFSRLYVAVLKLSSFALQVLLIKVLTFSFKSNTITLYLVQTEPPVLLQKPLKSKDLRFPELNSTHFMIANFLHSLQTPYFWHKVRHDVALTICVTLIIVNERYDLLNLKLKSTWISFTRGCNTVILVLRGRIKLSPVVNSLPVTISNYIGF